MNYVLLIGCSSLRPISSARSLHRRSEAFVRCGKTRRIEKQSNEGSDRSFRMGSGFPRRSPRFVPSRLFLRMVPKLDLLFLSNLALLLAEAGAAVRCVNRGDPRSRSPLPKSECAASSACSRMLLVAALEGCAHRRRRSVWRVRRVCSRFSTASGTGREDARLQNLILLRCRLYKIVRRRARVAAAAFDASARRA